MTVMYSFCFWFSVRLGSIIVGLTCMVQCILGLIACGVGMEDLLRTSKDINYWLRTNDLMITTDFFTGMRDNPESHLTGFIAALTVYLCACILLIYGAFKCNLYFIYPFVLLDLIRLVVLTCLLVVILLLVKKNTQNLGLVIACSVSGCFILMYLWYQWLCTVALVQIIREIDRMSESNATSDTTINPQKNIYKKSVNFTGDYQDKFLQNPMPMPHM